MLKGFIAVKTSFELVNDSHTDNDDRKVGTRPPDVAVITTVQVSAFLCHLFRRTINTTQPYLFLYVSIRKYLDSIFTPNMFCIRVRNCYLENQVNLCCLYFE